MRKQQHRSIVYILMPVYNGSKYLKESIDSILNQYFSDFELIIINDGSTDNSLEIIQGYKDTRINIIQNEHNFIGSLNKGLAACRGKYIVRMDADDIMMPGRLEKQVEIMENNPQIAVCSSWAECFGRSSGVIGKFEGEIRNPSLLLLDSNFIIHPTVMMRSDFLKNNKLRYKEYPHAEDYKLWTDIAKRNGLFYVINDCLIKYRQSDTQISYINYQKQKDTARIIRLEVLHEVLKSSELLNIKELRKLFWQLLSINEKGLLAPEDIFQLFFKIFSRTEINNLSENKDLEKSIADNLSFGL